MPTQEDYYNLLGVSRTSSQDEIRKAFRSMARQHHPDVNNGERESEEKFKDIKAAYDVLSDPEKRRYYDQYGTAQPTGGGAGGFAGGGFGVDLFDLFFNGGQRAPQRNEPREGSDLRFDMELTLEEAATGAEKVFSIDREKACSTCTGTGSRPGSNPVPCAACHGSGQVRRTQQTMLGSFATVGACSQCQGQGTIISDPCPSCRGQGRQRVSAEIKIHVPPGVDTGSRIQMPREGDEGYLGGRPGDLYIFVHVAAHDRFERRGSELVTEFPISFMQAALGDTIHVPTLHGVSDIKVPAGTQPGHVFRVRNQGMPGLNGRGRGDLHVVVKMTVPERLTDRQRKAIEEMAAAFGELPESFRPESSHLSEGQNRTEGHGIRGLFEKAREVFDK